MISRSILLLAVGLLLVTKLAVAFDVNELRSKAEAGDAVDQYELAMAYDSGRGIEKDLSQALDELQKEMGRAEIREGKRRSKGWDKGHRPL